MWSGENRIKTIAHAGQPETEGAKLLQIVGHKKYIDERISDREVLIPNGAWVDRINRQAKGAPILGVWVTILQIWSRCPGDGYLTVDGTKIGEPLSAPHLARLMLIPEQHLAESIKLITHSLQVLTSLNYVRRVNQIRGVDQLECVDPFPLYQIVDYDDHFENNKSRERAQCAFVCVPNKHGGTGLCNLLSQPDNLSIYGFWMLLLQLCSRQRKPRLGYVTADGKIDGRRLGADELARTFRTSKTQVCRSLEVLRLPEVGFLRLVGGEPESSDTVRNDGSDGH
jgi:hypothetical protein